MNKNKLIVMFITFAVLIALTPLLFGKLMNAKYNEMLNNLRKEGLKIKVLKNKSTYIQTDKILEVTIPSKLLKSNGVINSISLKVETRFKNLPVTSVIFLGNVENVSLNGPFKKYEEPINSFLKKHFKFVATTPNFKDYGYKVNDIVVKGNSTIGIKGIEGTARYTDGLKNSLTIGDMYVKKSNELIEIKNFKNEIEGNEKHSFSKVSMDINVDLNTLKMNIKNIYSYTGINLNKNADINFVLGFKKLKVSNSIDADNFKTELDLKGIKTELLEKMAKAGRYEQNEYLNKIFDNGFKIKISSSLGNADFISKTLGGYDINLSMAFLPTNNALEKINSQNLNFVDAKLHAVTTPAIANIIMQILPKSAFAFALAKKQNGKMILNLELKQGKLYSEGQLIK